MLMSTCVLELQLYTRAAATRKGSVGLITLNRIPNHHVLRSASALHPAAADAVYTTL